jgi:hypothetical protein
VLTVLRQGEESDEWKNALRFADEFVWSAQPKTSESEITRLRALLPQLEKALRHGLATVAYHESDIKQLMGELSSFYKRLLDGQRIETKTVKQVIAESATANAATGVDGADPVPSGETAAAAATQSPVEEIVLGSSTMETETEAPAEAEEDDFVKTVRAIKVGTWIEFTDDGGQCERAKLSWISPISSKYLFVNRRGLKVCDKTVFGLAAELRRGTAVVLEEVPLFDRALDAIVARLRHTGDESSPAAAPATPPAAPA